MTTASKNAQNYMEKSRILIFVPTNGKDEEAIREKYIDRVGCDASVIVFNNKQGIGLTKLYNRVLDSLRSSENTIIVYAHDDLDLFTRNWGKKLLDTFNSTDYAILGVAGNEVFTNTCKWWSYQPAAHGAVMQHDGDRVWIPNLKNEDDDGVDEVLVVDGLFIAVDPSRVRSRFDESFDKFHFYDITFCLDNVMKGAKIGVANWMHLAHDSVGKLNSQWEEGKAKCIKKYGHLFPMAIKSFAVKSQGGE